MLVEMTGFMDRSELQLGHGLGLRQPLGQEPGGGLMDQGSAGCAQAAAELGVLLGIMELLQG